MNTVHGYGITFATIAVFGFDGKRAWRFSYTIRNSARKLIESVEGRIAHEVQRDALDEAIRAGGQHLDKLSQFGIPDIYHQSWSTS